LVETNLYASNRGHPRDPGSNCRFWEEDEEMAELEDRLSSDLNPKETQPRESYRGVAREGAIGTCPLKYFLNKIVKYINN